MLNSLTAVSAPIVTGDTISWPDDGWYQVQKSSDYSEVCAGGRSCKVSPGTYDVVNHSTGKKFRDIVVYESSSSIVVTGNTIAWPDDGWYQVQKSSDYSEVCAGGHFCIVSPGTYDVVNHSTGEKFRDVVVSAFFSPIVVTGNTISWPDDGWYQVQTSNDYTEVCADGRSCVVPAGTYVVTNHSTGARYENIVVGNGSGSTLEQLITNAGLGPLPNPPLSPAPGNDSEPLVDLAAITTITEFLPVRDPVRNLEDTTDILDDDDFNAGPLPAVFYTPDHVNPQKNTAPYFENLNDVEVVAGELTNILFAPKDPDGGLAGQFAHALPPGARFVDNLNATKSLVWRPLQPSVGINEFTVTATDAVEPFYRTERTIRIKVVLPADTSNIPNLPPGINLLRNSTVRKGDPVVAYIKVTDPNGTVPSLTLVNAPPGTTVTPHSMEPEISILHFIPQEAGTITLELLARDALDSTLTASTTVLFEVLNEEDFARPGQRLKDLANSHSLLFGYAAMANYYQQPDGAIYADIAGEEFNFVTTENSLKWDLINPLPGKYRWEATDNIVEQAKHYQQQIHGHTLVWYAQLPQWIKRSPLTLREGHMREHINRVLNRYADDVKVWDVVNEAFEDDGSFRNSVWYEAMGESYIDTAFKQARASAPDATLLFNEYDIGFEGPKLGATISLLERLKAENVPIDGLGFQLHLEADFDGFAELAAVFARIADIGVDIYVTELDVSMSDGQTMNQQAHVYEGILDACLNQSACKAFQIWGFTDKYSWRRDNTPLIFDKRYQPKPAYLALQRRLSEAP